MFFGISLLSLAFKLVEAETPLDYSTLQLYYLIYQLTANLMDHDCPRDILRKERKVENK